MLRRQDVLGHRIRRIFVDMSLSDHEYNYADFICLLDNGLAFRLPHDDESGDLFPTAKVSEAHVPATFPKRRWLHYPRRLWWARITDVLVPADPELRFPDSSRVALDSGWYLAQMSGGPIGVIPCIDIMPELMTDQELVTIWEAA